jgi:hypothetical protein
MLSRRMSCLLRYGVERLLASPVHEEAVQLDEEVVPARAVHSPVRQLLVDRENLLDDDEEGLVGPEQVGTLLVRAVLQPREVVARIV